MQDGITQTGLTCHVRDTAVSSCPSDLHPVLGPSLYPSYPSVLGALVSFPIDSLCDYDILVSPCPLQ